jgi:hypothetical protein
MLLSFKIVMMKKSLITTFLLIICLSLKGQIKEWQITDTFKDYQHTGIESTDKRYIAKIIGKAITVFDTKNNNKEIIAGLTNGQYGGFSGDNPVYISFMNDQISIRYLEKNLEEDGIKYIKTPTKISSILVSNSLVYCSFEHGKISVYDWQKRQAINSFQVGKNEIIFVKQNKLNNAVIFKEEKTGLFFWNLDTYKVLKINDKSNRGWFSEDGRFVYYEAERKFYQFDSQNSKTELLFSVPKEQWTNEFSEDIATFGFAINPQNTLLATFDYAISDDIKYKSTYHLWDFSNGKPLKTVGLKHKIFALDFKKSGNEIIAQLIDTKQSETKTYIHLNNVSNFINAVTVQKNTSKNKDETPEFIEKSVNSSRKVALVFGNSKYKFNDLKGIPVNDATDVSKRLNELGFTVNFLHDASKKEIDQVLANLGKTISSTDVIVFFYAGHGIEVDGRNYLIPIDATLEKKSDVANETVALDDILALMKKLNVPVNLIYLDACRNNPFRSWSRGDESLGFSEVEINMPTMKVYYATQPGSVAANGTGRNGVFTSALLKFLKKGTDCDELMRNITKEVYIQTKQVQVPWQKGSLINEFKF